MPEVYEPNHLATRLSAMSPWGLDRFEGMAMVDSIKTDYAPITVERLINMTHSTADCQIACEAQGYPKRVLQYHIVEQEKIQYNLPINHLKEPESNFNKNKGCKEDIL